MREGRFFFSEKTVSRRCRCHSCNPDMNSFSSCMLIKGKNLKKVYKEVPVPLLNFVSS